MDKPSTAISHVLWVWLTLCIPPVRTSLILHQTTLINLLSTVMKCGSWNSTLLG